MESKHAIETTHGDVACRHCGQIFDTYGETDTHAKTGDCPEYVPSKEEPIEAADTAPATDADAGEGSEELTPEEIASRSDHATVVDGEVACSHCEKQFPTAKSVNSVSAHFARGGCPEYDPSDSFGPFKSATRRKATTAEEPTADSGSGEDTTKSTTASSGGLGTRADQIYRLISRVNRPQFSAPEDSSDTVSSGYDTANYLSETLFNKKAEVIAALIGLALGISFAFDPQGTIARLVALFGMAYGVHGFGKVGASDRTRWLDSLPDSYKRLATSGKLLEDAHYLLGAFLVGAIARWVDNAGSFGLLPGRGAIPEWIYSGYLELHYHGGSTTFPTLASDAFDVVRVLAGF